MADIQSVCTWNALSLTNSTSRGFSSSPSYAYSAYGFSLQTAQARVSRNWRPSRSMHCSAAQRAWQVQSKVFVLAMQHHAQEEVRSGRLFSTLNCYRTA